MMNNRYKQHRMRELLDDEKFARPLNPGNRQDRRKLKAIAKRTMPKAEAQEMCGLIDRVGKNPALLDRLSK